MLMVLVNQNYRFLAIWLPFPFLTKEDLVTIGNKFFCIFIQTVIILKIIMQISMSQVQARLF